MNNIEIDTLQHLIDEYLQSPGVSNPPYVDELLQNAAAAIRQLSERLVTERAKTLLAEEKADDLK
jgi:hypothetical protein